MTLRKYAPLWNKYRPAILKMMLEAAAEPQTYKLMQHELVALDGKKKSNFGFSLRVSGSKAVNNIKDSELAQDLLNMLQLSRKATELTGLNTYDITLDRQLTLHVSQLKVEQEQEQEQLN
jgi:hypothetical protein